MAEDAWNTCDPDIVVLAYSEDSDWRNRNEFFKGRDSIRAFLYRKWRKELHYKLMKELWAYTNHRIAWFRTHGNEHWEFNEQGFMVRRDMSANDVPISSDERRLST